MPRVPLFDLSNASPEVLSAVRKHLDMGYRLTNEKKTLLHSLPCFEALEAESYRIDRLLQGIVGKRAADLFEYAVSIENDCLVCSVYFVKLLRQYGIDDPEAFEPLPDEALLMEYGHAMARDPKHVPDELFSRLQARFTPQEIVVITTMGVFMTANNHFNDILQVEPEAL